MPREVRAFRQDFREHFRLLDAWPKPEALRAWLRENYKTGIRNGICGELAEGKPHDKRDLAWIVDYLRQEFRLREVFYAYLQSTGVADPAGMTLEQLVEHLSDPAKPGLFDTFMEGMEFVKAVFDRVRHPATCVDFCRTEADVREAIRWMFIECGRHMSKTSLSSPESIRRGKSAMALPADYQERAVGWWRTEPWTVIRTWGYRKPAGMSIVLPVTAEAYEAVRRGDRKTYWCTPDDLCSPSPQIILEGVAIRPEEEAPEQEGTILHIFAAILCQEAHLSDLPGIGYEIPLRLLAFAGTPKTRRRAMRAGHKPTNTFMHGTDIEFLEKQLLLDKRGHRDWAIWGIWTGLQKATADLTPPTTGANNQPLTASSQQPA